MNKDFDLLRKDCECYSLFMEHSGLPNKGEFQNVLVFRIILLLSFIALLTRRRRGFDSCLGHIYQFL